MLDPFERCLAIFSLGCLLVLGYIFNWEWLYPSHHTVRNYHSGIRRPLVLISGVLLMLCSILFYIYRDSMIWQ